MLRVNHAAFSLIAAALILMLLPACKEKPGATATGGSSTSKSSTGQQYPIAWDKRPYSVVHPSVKQAWFLTESAYVVVKGKWKKSTGEVRKNVEKELDRSIFGVEDEVKQLFEDAIKAEPENPLNYAAYAVYLKPRKYIKEGGFTNAYPDALKNVDKAIELWPDEARFYLLKIWIVTAPNLCHDWYRAGLDEEMAIAAALPDLLDLYSKAEQYDPDNSNINYEKACTLFRYTPPEKHAAIRDDLLREIRAGNLKTTSYFTFPPPLDVHAHEAKLILLNEFEYEARYYDHWNQFGNYSGSDISEIITSLISQLQWPKDKDEIADVMFFAYSAGRTKPYSRSFFSMQHVIMNSLLAQTKEGSKERLKLAEAARNLNDQYKTVTTQMLSKRILKDSTLLDAAGVEKVEQGLRQLNVEEHLQPHQAAYLKRFGEIMGVEFPLDKNPENW